MLLRLYSLDAYHFLFCSLDDIVQVINALSVTNLLIGVEVDMKKYDWKLAVCIDKALPDVPRVQEAFDWPFDWPSNEWFHNNKVS